MKLKYLILLTSFLSINILYPQERKFNLNYYAVYENLSLQEISDISEFSNILSMNYSITPNLSLALTTRHASVSGDIDKLSGLTDTQLLSVYKLQNLNISVNGGVNIPSGKTKLNQNEFNTSQVISHNLLNLRTAGFGQGTNIFLGATWLKPLSDNFIIGLGLSYQVKGEYQPLKDITSKYKPSNEISFTGGFDVKLNETSTLTGDVTGIFYGSDKLDGQEVFSTGSRIVVSMLYKRFSGFNYFSASLLLRKLDINKLMGIYSLLDNEKSNPDQFYLGLSYMQRITPGFKLEYSIFTSIYEQTASAFSGYTMIGAGLNPVIKVSDALSVPIFIKYSAGLSSTKSNLKNYEAGAGVMLNF